jgi:hypothetical protein
MRKPVLFVLALFAVSLLVVPNQLSAQSIFLGGGATFPTGDYGDYADVGWLAEAGFSLALGDGPWSALVTGIYGGNGHSYDEATPEPYGSDDDKTSLLGGLVGVEYSFSEAREAGPFLFGEVGLLRHKYEPADDGPTPEPYGEESETGFAFGGGIGYSVPFGRVSGYALARYLNGRFDDGNTAFFGVMAGVSIPLGGN